MMKLTFLKIEGLRGPSYAPRHLGDFEVSTYTFSNDAIVRTGPKQLYQATFNYLLVYKRTNETPNSLRSAWTNSRAFATGELIPVS